MKVSALQSAASYTGIQPRAVKFDSNDFMKLLIAQLQNQDPLAPMNSQEFLAQLAQLQSVAKLNELHQTLQEYAQRAGLAELESVARLNELHQTMQEYAQSAGLVGPVALLGRTVRWMSEGEWEQGVVEAVRLEAEGAVAVVDGQEIELSQIQEVL